MAIPTHLIDRAWEIYTSYMTDTGAPPPEKLYWIAGFAAAIGVLAGSLPVGIPEGTLTKDVMGALVGELADHRAEIGRLEELAKKKLS